MTSSLPPPDVLGTPRTIEFLTESNAIEDIFDIDYAQPQHRIRAQGHWGAYADAVDVAARGAPLAAADICRWQSMICTEQVAFGHSLPDGFIGRLRGPANPVNVRVGAHIAPDYARVPELFDAWLRDTNARAVGRAFADSEIVVAIADTFQTFESLHPFGDGNGRTGRIIAAWMSLRHRTAPIVFRREERQAFYTAHRSKRAMRRFVAGKIREAVIGLDGSVLPVAKRGDSSDLYLRQPEGQSLIVERHELIDAVRRWTEEEQNDS